MPQATPKCHTQGLCPHPAVLPHPASLVGTPDLRLKRAAAPGAGHIPTPRRRRNKSKLRHKSETSSKFQEGWYHADDTQSGDVIF